MRLRIAKVDEQTVAEILRDVPVKTLDDRSAGGLVGLDYLTQVFRIQLPRESGGRVTAAILRRAGPLPG
jgi:hypothetical protein